MANGRSKKPAVTIARVTDEAPRRGRSAVDSGEEEFDQLLRQLVVITFHRWCKTAIEAKAIKKMPTDKERADVIDDLTAMWACPTETMLDAAVETFMSTAVDEGDEVDCPACKTTLEIPEDFEDGSLLQCSKCDHEFDPDDENDDDGDDDDDPDGGIPVVVATLEPPAEETPKSRRRA